MRPLVVLHGLFGSSRNWQSISRKLTTELPGKEVYPIDLRNHNCVNNPSAIVGQVQSWTTLQNDLETYWRDKLNQRDFDLLGHSFGGQIAMSSVLTESKLRLAVNKLVIVDVSLRHPSAEHENDKLFNLMTKMIEINEMRLTERVDVIKELSTVEQNDNVINFLLLNLIKCNGHYTFDNLSLVNLIESWPRLKSQWSQIKNSFIPWNGETLFIKGEHSDYIRTEDETEIHRYFTNSRIEAIRKSGHWPHFDNQEEFINKLISFL